jgi:predicted RNA binding protein YcfA (HicA-like mRNA interferase family)
MKRNAFLKVLNDMGCVFVNHGKKHDRYKQPSTGKAEMIPRHSDIDEYLAKAIIKKLSD